MPPQDYNTKTEDLPVPKKDLLRFVSDADQMSMNAFRARFQSIADRYKTYIRQDRDPLRMNIHGNLTYTVLDAFLSLEYSYEISVKFQPNESLPISEERAEYRTAALKQDYEQGNYGAQIDRSRFFKYFSGVGVTLLDKWDITAQRPSMTAIPPNLLILDPEGGSDPENHRYIGLNVNYRASEMLKTNGEFDQDAVYRLLTGMAKKKAMQNKQRTGAPGHPNYPDNTRPNPTGQAAGTTTNENERQQRADQEAVWRGEYSKEPFSEGTARKTLGPLKDVANEIIPCVLLYATITDQNDMNTPVLS